MTRFVKDLGGPAAEVTSPPASMARQATSSVIWMTAAKWVARLGGLATIVLLTRMLSPEDFGMAAAAITLMPLVYVFADVGFSAYIVQAEDADEETLGTAFWFSITAGLALTGAVVACTPLLEQLFHLPEVGPLLRVMALSVLVIAVGAVPTALLQRRMGFRLLAGVQVVSAALAQVVAVVAAFQGMGAWALILQVLVSQVVATVLVWILARWRPTLAFSIRRFREMATFGLHVAGSSFAMVVRYWAETAIVVATLGVYAMGLLNIGQRLVQTAEELTMAALATVSVAAFARLRDSSSRLRASYLRGVSIAYAVSMPLMVSIGVSAPVLVPFLFGADKAGSAVLIMPLAAGAVLGVVRGLDQGLFTGVGKPGRWLVFLVVGQILSVAALMYVVRFGLLVFALGMLAVGVLDTIARCFLVGNLLGARPWEVIRPLVRVLPPAGIAAAAGWLVQYALHGRSEAPDLPAVVVLMATGFTIVGCYLLLLRLLSPGVVGEIVALAPGRIAARFPARTLS